MLMSPVAFPFSEIRFLMLQYTPCLACVYNMKSLYVIKKGWQGNFIRKAIYDYMLVRWYGEMSSCSLFLKKFCSWKNNSK